MSGGGKGGRGGSGKHDTPEDLVCVSEWLPAGEECEINQRSGQMKVLSSQKMNFPTERSGIEDSVSFSSFGSQLASEKGWKEKTNGKTTRKQSESQ